MRVGINLLYLLPTVVGGTETYARSLLRALSEADSENKYFIFINREMEGEDLGLGPNFTCVATGVRATSRLGRYAWEQIAFPLKLRRYRLDVLHSLGYVGPFRPPCRHVLTVPDVNYRGVGSAMGSVKRTFLPLFVWGSVRGAEHIITISEYSKQEIVRHLSVDPDRITVAHLGPREPVAIQPEEMRSIRERYRLRDNYLVAFSSTSPHKNIPRLLVAYSRLVDRVPHALVLVGRTPADSFISAEIRRLGLEDRVNLTGYVSDAEMTAIVRSASLLVFPSLYEGFGLPILDAQQVGTPIASSMSGSLPEVAGEGAQFFHADSVDEMTAAIDAVLGNPGRQRELAALGAKNVKRFSWQDTASTTRRVYAQLVSHGKTGGPVA